MKISINRSQKIKLLKAIFSSTFDTVIFPELEKALIKDGMRELIDHGHIDTRDEFFRNSKY